MMQQESTMWRIAIWPTEENIDSNNTRLTSSNNHVNEASRVKNEIHDIRRADNLFMRPEETVTVNYSCLDLQWKLLFPVFRVFSSMIFRKKKKRKLSFNLFFQDNQHRKNNFSFLNNYLYT